MSEHQAYERAIGAPASTKPRGKFRQNADGDDIALPAYRDMYHPLRGFLVANRPGPRPNARGVQLHGEPRVNEARRARRNVGRGA